MTNWRNEDFFYWGSYWNFKNQANVFVIVSLFYNPYIFKYEKKKNIKQRGELQSDGRS